MTVLRIPYGALMLGFALVLTVLGPVQAREIIRDLPYGLHPKQRMDVYLPDVAPKGAPIMFYVHGGGWSRGDKTNTGRVLTKARHWNSQGYIFISSNNRLMPDANPLEQADDVADAVVFVQKNAAQWGANPKLMILMGHSAGAHLVSLVSADPSILHNRGGFSPLATIALDGAAYDIKRIMTDHHHRFYDEIFGNRLDLWQDASPTLRVKKGAPPMLLVCGAFRRTACDQAYGLAAKMQDVGSAATVMPVKLSHRSINTRLGTRGDYTRQVDAFLGALKLK